jgi:hypothetical protein
MLDFFKRLFGLAPKPVAVTEPAPYKVETPATVEELAPVVADKKEATGAVKTTRRRKKTAAT